MENNTLQGKLTGHTGTFMAALLLAQPVLDVVSFFMGGVGLTGITTALRCLLLAVVSLYGCIITDNRQAYAAMYSVVGAFWLLHALNCLRTGYVNPMGDFAEYLKLIQFPLWTVSFITFLEKKEELHVHAPGFLAANFGIVLLVILLSYVTGRPAYTYDFAERGIRLGILGWFGVPNTQSAILCLLVTGLLLWAYGTEKLWVFSAACVPGFGLLFFTGTRLTYYSAMLLAVAFLVLILLGRRHILFCVPLLLSLVALLVFRGYSPMVQRQVLTADSYSIYEEKALEIMGEDGISARLEKEEISPERMEKIRRIYTEIYSQPGVYGGPLLGDLLERFGVERVMEHYGYATSPQVLYNARTKRLAVLGLIWDEKDFLTKLLGFEYAEATVAGYNYDPENDLSALPFYYGYLGTALYLGFIACFALLVLKALLENLRNLPDFLTAELGAWSLICILTLGAGQFSGQVLRKPSVTVYFSLAAAQLFYMLYPPRRERRFEKYLRKPVVTMKLP